MSHQARRFTVSACLAFFVAPWAAGGEPEAAVAEVVKPFLVKTPHVSLAVGVVTPAGSKSYGFGTVNLDGKDQKPDEQTLYEIGSITKVFTGTLLAQLALEKKIKPDDPVQPWLPAEWKLPRRDDRDITFLHLATHTSGLPVEPPGLGLIALLAGTTDDPYGKFESPAVAKTLATIRLPEPIGVRHDYSNLGVGLLGHALAKAGGAATYEELVAKRVFRPLGMDGSAIRLTKEQKKLVAPGHDGSGEPAGGWNFATLEGCGGIRSNVRDMLKFAEAAMGKAETPLKPAFTFAQQPWRELPVKNLAVGLCWMRSGTGDHVVIWHNGGTGGYTSFLGFRPKTGVGVVVLCNGADQPLDDLGLKILKALEK